jgi:hypothetical protein
MSEENDKTIDQIKLVVVDDHVSEEIFKKGLTLARKEPRIKEHKKIKTVQYDDGNEKPVITYLGDKVTVTKCCEEGLCPHHIAMILIMEDQMEVMEKIVKDGVDIITEKEPEEAKAVVGQEFEGTLEYVKNPQWLSGKVETDVFTGFAKFNEVFQNGTEFKEKCPVKSQIKGKLIMLPEKNGKPAQASITKLDQITQEAPNEVGLNTGGESAVEVVIEPQAASLVPSTQPACAPLISRPREISVENLLVRPVASVDKIVGAWEQFEELKKRLLTKDDISLIPVKKGGKVVGFKPSIDKSGWRKMATAFGIEDEIVEEARLTYPSYYVWRYKVRVIDLRSGRTGIGIGACSSSERNFTHGEADIIMMSHTRAKSRAISDLVGGGSVSSEEMEDLELSPENTKKFITTEQFEKIKNDSKKIAAEI